MNWSATYKSCSHIESNIICCMHNWIGKPDMETISEHWYFKRGPKMRLIKTWECTTGSAWPEHRCCQISKLFMRRKKKWLKVNRILESNGSICNENENELLPFNTIAAIILINIKALWFRCHTCIPSHI